MRERREVSTTPMFKTLPRTKAKTKVQIPEVMKVKQAATTEGATIKVATIKVGTIKGGELKPHFPSRFTKT